MNGTPHQRLAALVAQAAANPTPVLEKGERGVTHRGRILIAFGALCLIGTCALSAVPGAGSLPSTDGETNSLDRLAQSYVKLVLAVGEHDPDYVDAYYGPPVWRHEVKAAKLPLSEIQSQASALLTELRAQASDQAHETVRLRHTSLSKQVQALVARVEMLGGRRLSFAEEIQVLYDVPAPPSRAEQFAAVQKQLEKSLPGDGPLVQRYQAFRKDFVIPVERLDAVFKAAIAECRGRTLRYLSLPPAESFRMEYVQGKPWDAYNSYHGNFHSLIQINTSLPIYIDYALLLACHEGYPGHHVYGVLREQKLVRERGWVEFSITALYSPQSLVAEGSAQYGLQLAFPEDERLQFWRTRLFPLAGLDPVRAEDYFRVQLLYDQISKLSYAGSEVAHKFLDEQISARAATDWLVTNSLLSMASAEQFVRFIAQYRSYVINYNLGQDLVRRYVETRAGSPASASRMWQVFQDLITSPRQPSDLH